MDKIKYAKSIVGTSNVSIEWDLFRDKSITISGATGMIGKYLIDLIMFQNLANNMKIKIIALGRNLEKAKERFADYFDNENFMFICCDINKRVDLDIKSDYMIHLASPTHPHAYAVNPIETITSNIIGTLNLLEWHTKNNGNRFLLASSVEIYGENINSNKTFLESDLGYLDCNTLRAGYPESKRASEALCQAFIKQKGIDAVIARLSRVYGPTMLLSDTKAIAQFIKNGIAKEDIVLKSAGKQVFSFCYVADAVSALLYILTKGNNGEAYNVSDLNSDYKLIDVATMIAEISGKSIIYDMPNNTEKMGFSTASRAIINSEKLKSLGWKSNYNLKEGITETLNILR